MVPIEEETGWIPEPVWPFWRREKYLATAGIRTLDRTARSLVAIPTTLLWFLHYLNTFQVSIFQSYTVPETNSVITL